MPSYPAQRPVTPARAAAYHRLTLTILGLDVPTLTADLRAQRLEQARPTTLSAPPRRAA